MVTLETIAKHVGVSKSTVSRVLNYDESLNIKPETRAVIFHAAEKLNYSTKKYKKKLKEVLVVLNLSTSAVEHDDPFFISIRLAIEKRCATEKIKASFLYLDNIEHAFNNSFYRSIDGIIVVGSLSIDFVDTLQKLCNNIISISFEYEKLNIPAILTDEYRSPSQLLELLYEQGQRKIIYIGPKNNPRAQAYVDFCTKYDLPTSIYPSDFSLPSGLEAMELAIKDGLDATTIVCASDTIAIGGMKALYKANYSIPGDVQITGFNNITSSAYTQPSLTTINVHEELMVELAVNELIENFSKTEILAVRQFVPTELILRNSTLLTTK